MHCRFVKSGNGIICTAVSAHYLPSDFEKQEYCLADRHRMCPFYCMIRTDGAFDLSGMELQSRTAVC
ncbi:MAG: hypothetical protein OEW15_15090 [Nitrospirota bacterium]|nr:hypothetical protein [Nitrospirota bacterium]